MVKMRVKSVNLNFIRTRKGINEVCCGLVALACLAFGNVIVSAQKSSAAPAQVSRQIVTTTAPSPRSASTPAPVEVITVVHRLSGWKLRAWLAQNHLELDAKPSDDFVHTKVVAGCMLNDRRTIIARLPQAEIEALSSPPEVAANSTGRETRNESAIVVVRRDGRLLRAKFIGLDASTGLSLLEIAASVSAQTTPAHRATEQTVDASTQSGAAQTLSLYTRQLGLLNGETALAGSGNVTQGQRVRLFAPVPNGRTDNNGSLRIRISMIEGLISGVSRLSSGQIRALQVQSTNLTPQFYGAVALNESGGFVGIVEKSSGGEAHLTPVAEVRGAARRVLARRTSVPQAWLGARGDAVAMLSLERFVESGWRVEEARRLLVERQGVMLTAIAPNAPAAAAGLRPGDIVLRVGDKPVRTTEEFTFMLREAGNNSTIGFTVLRRTEQPRRVEVRLSESLNPSQMTYRRIITGQMRMETPPTNLLLTLGLEAISLPPPPAGQPLQLSGMLVFAVKPQSAAALGGVRAGDVIEAINGRSVFVALREVAGEAVVAEQTANFALTVLRDGQRVTLNVARQSVP